MAFASLDKIKLADPRRCDKDGCNRWWHKSNFGLVSNDTYDIYLKCPHCREARTYPTKYWHGGLDGPREPAYVYPAKMPQTPQMHPLPPNPSGDRQTSAKRQMSGGTLTPTPSQNKKPKLHQQQTTPASTPTASVAETAIMVARKDSLTSTASPTAAKAEPSLELMVSNLKRHYEEWKACNGHPETYKQEELQKAEVNLKTLKSRIPPIERTMQETQQQQVEAQEELNRMEILQKEIDASVKKARVNEGRHKPIKDQWYMGPRKHAQLAYEENNRCSKAWQKAMKDRADAQRIEMEAKQKIEEILEERKQLESFGVYVAGLPAASNSA